MKKVILVLTILANSAFAQFNFGANTITGTRNTADGNLNSVSGTDNTAIGTNHTISGSRGFAAGYWNNVNALASFALGTRAVANQNHAMAFGIDVRATNNRSMIIGTGVDNGVTNAMINNIPNSLMIGYNSTIPTLFVGPGTGANTLGNVGIGTTIPESRLHVNGDIRLPNTNRIIFGQQSNGTGEWVQNSNSIFPSNPSGTHGISLFTNSIERLRVSNLGMIGINVSNPTTTLHVIQSLNQNAAPSFVRFEKLPQTTCGYVIMVDDNGYMYRSTKKGNPCVDTGACNANTKSIMEETDIFTKYEALSKKVEELNREVQSLKVKK